MTDKSDEIPTDNSISSSRRVALKRARDAKDDEFYTRLPDVEKELVRFSSFFRDKVVYCNCDMVKDPDTPMADGNSAFYAYFRSNFERLGLKALICSWYEKDSNQARFVIVTGNGTKYGAALADPSSGSYDSDTAMKFLSVCDVVVTNPPFSIYKKFFKFLVDSGKKFLIVSPGTCPTYRDVFKEIKDNKVWPGYTGLSTFYVPDDRTEKVIIEKFTGKKTRVANATWMTNIPTSVRNEALTLWNTYDEGKFTKYHNLDGIDVPHVAEIPKDYFGYIGVPISFLSVYNPDQFELVGIGVGKSFDEIPGSIRLDAKFVQDYFAAGGKGAYAPNFPILGYYKDGVAKIPFARLVIKRKVENAESPEVRH